MSSKSATHQANALWQKQPKANAEMFALTYGALIGELLRDLEDSAAVNAELDRMGHSMGIRCIEELLAKSDSVPVKTFQDTMDVLVMALRMFFGITVESTSSTKTFDASSSNNNEEKTTIYCLRFSDNPLALFVELPDDRLADNLQYNQWMAGMCRGMLEMLQFDCDVQVTKSPLTSTDDTINELTVKLKQVLQEGAGEDYQEE